VNGRTLQSERKEHQQNSLKDEEFNYYYFQNGIQEQDDHLLRYRIRPLMKGRLAYRCAWN